MWKKKIKQKKIQFILIAIILMVSSSIFAISISLTSTVEEYTNEYYKGENIKDIVVQTYNKDIISRIEDFIEKKEPKENDIRYSDALMVDRQVFLESKNLDLSMASLVTFENKKSHPWDVVITEGEKRDRPSRGTIWVPNIIADYKDIKIGDKLRIKDGKEYKYLSVSALVNESLIPNSMVGSTNLYINKEDYKTFNNLVKSHFIGYNSSKEAENATKELSTYIGDSFEGLMLDKWITNFVANSTSMITGAIGMSIALLIFIVSIIIIRFVLWSNILKEYKSIGVYKSIGYTSKQIRSIYLKSYGIVGIISIIIGSFLSIGFINYMVNISVKYIGIYEGNNNNFTFIFLTIAIMSLVLITNIYLLLRRINKINPVEAFRVGVTSSKEKFKKSLIKDASSPLSMAINDIFKHKKQNLIIVTILSMVMYVSAFIVSGNYSMENIAYNAWNVFGTIQGDIALDFPTGDESYDKALEELRNDSRILEVRECSFDVGQIVYLDTTKYNIKNAQVITTLIDNYENNEGFNVSIKEGRNPKLKNEIALTEQILKDANLEIGDYIRVKVLGEEKSLLITGSYTSMMSNNYSMRMTLDIVPKDMRNSLLNLNLNATLKDKNDYDSVKKDYKEKYEVASVDISPSLIVQTAKSVVETITPVTRIILTGILIFSILNIINLIMMNNTDNRRNNAIMKSLGFSNKYIISRTSYRIIILTVISSLFGFTLNLIISKDIFKIAMSGIDGLMIPYNLVSTTILFIAIITILTTIISMLSIRKISIVELMEE
ncbi:ABC transporter permease [[Clostridium] sordellii]|uniref:ABC transporter permease n=1 Tax=Paraclostridium sordellii TaxID=1505 RepID=UPI0005E26DA8|nr:FtsX-like permease family protein [Paeniclostridium sordellii]MCQ4696661.1 FtsX-like permease family protein [Paeniclostridium sordellii]MDU4414419.1 FtsX-like permease family protein [Paeniclostridium sordellii]MDU6481688.1 FtsX-like permease family protein [Paeniclostridium sordellii]MVO75512.1 FtsX-like permease family protein [Paeniclostridium sordellii]CEN83929.1 ABC transporter permease [[Clostridium] sordellii] [Paeniclostridium sordellii]